jgi:carboxyl-terminal processing protease
VLSDIVIPGLLSYSDIGEKFGKYPLENETIKSNFEDDLSDIPFLQRDRIRLLYKFDLQKPLKMYAPYMDQLKQNSDHRVTNDKNYQSFLKEIQKKSVDIDPDNPEQFGQNDLQLQEAYNLMKDLIFLMHN